MRKELNDIRFITLPSDREIGGTTIRSDIPLPIQFPEGSVTDDIDVNSIVAGLIKVVAWSPEDENIEYYKNLLLEMQPGVIEELNLAAVAKGEMKEYGFAEELMLAVNHLSDAPESYINLAVLYAQMAVHLHKEDRDSEADLYDDRIIGILNECKARHGDYAATYSEISAFHMRHGDVENARDYLARYIDLETDGKKREAAEKTLDGISGMLAKKDGIMYAYDKIMMGLPDEAIDLMDKYIAGDGKSWEAFFLRGWARRINEDFKGAQRDLLESLRIDGKNAEVYNELSICAREGGDVELAKNYLQIAVDLDGEDVVYLTNLAFLHLSSGEFSESRELLEKVRTIDPEDPQLKYLIKEYEKRTGDSIGDVISEQILTDEDFEDLHRKEREQGIPFREI